MPLVYGVEVPEIVKIWNRFLGREEKARFLYAIGGYCYYVGENTGTKYKLLPQEAITRKA